MLNQVISYHSMMDLQMNKQLGAARCIRETGCNRKVDEVSESFACAVSFSGRHRGYERVVRHCHCGCLCRALKSHLILPLPQNIWRTTSLLDYTYSQIRYVNSAQPDLDESTHLDHTLWTTSGLLGQFRLDCSHRIY